MKFPEVYDFKYVSEFQHWFASIENEWTDVLISSVDAEHFPEQHLQFLKHAEPVLPELIIFGAVYVQKLSVLNLGEGSLNAIRYNTFNNISYIELQYVFDQDPYHVWSAGFEKIPLQGYLIDVTTEELDYGFSAIILHREPL
ncbi:hypothetical protein BEN71_12760 [Acinetobacter wuhouensis]|uniref:hypothetical protein n=1 Tax=Acinetobacter wuhouensis TaxID=1879050 RepID=UPI00083A518C|nr:hypothetical protein [Acinetobacter wuhouensis]AXQ22889.1 hypothetical protein BEN71_12760 [Acinetobacter wuhouensis]